MGQRIEIRSLIRSSPQDGSAAITPAQNLPPAVAGSLPLWNIVAARASEVLEPLVQAELKVTIDLAIKTHADLRASADRPGVVLPLDPPERGALVRFPGNSAPSLTGLLLRAADTHHPEDAEPEELDGLVVISVIEALAGLIYAAFGLPLRMPTAVEPSMIWPLTPPPPEPRLLANFQLDIDGHGPAHIEILFRNTLETEFASLLRRGDQPLNIDRMDLEVTGVLSQWTAKTEELCHIHVGDRLVIPGADLKDVVVEASTAIGSKPLARAELGTLRGRHALRIQSLASL